MSTACFLVGTPLRPSLNLHPFPPPRRRPRPQFRCRSIPRALLRPRVPPSISSLDDDLPSPTPHKLSPEAEAFYLAKFPYLRDLQPPDSFFPKDGRVLSWAYRRYHRRPLLRLLRTLLLLGCLTGLVTYFVRKHSLTAVLVIAAQVDVLLNAILLVLMPVVLVTWALIRNDVQNDGARRSLIMHTLSSLLLLPVTMIASVGRIGLALIAGVVSRCVYMAGALWMWKDLREEIFLGNGGLVRVFRVWRGWVTWGVIMFGSLLRVLAMVKEEVMEHMGSTALGLRLSLGESFPTMLSLCNDPRGMFFLAGIMLSIGVTYAFYVGVYAMEMGQERRHREIGSALTRVMERTGVYKESKPKEGIVLSREGSLLSSSAMLLRRKEDVEPESRFLSEDRQMPAFSLLAKEAEILQKEGGEVWMKGREDGLEGGDEKKRATDFLLGWAREMSEDEGEMGFAEFFETLEEDEYRYDKDSGDWVFEDGRGKDDDMKEIADKVMKAQDESELDLEDLEKLVQHIGGVDLKEAAMQPGVDPELRRIILQRFGGDEEGEVRYA